MSLSTLITEGSPAQIVLSTGGIDVCKAECETHGLAWFERTTAAQTPSFSRYMGEQLGWRTRAAVDAMPLEATTIMGRMGLEFMAAGNGPFAADARRVLGDVPAAN